MSSETLTPGRPSKFRLTPEEKCALRLLVLSKGSIPLAVESFPSEPACTEATRTLILEKLDEAASRRIRVRWPISLLRAARTTEEEEALFRGEKHFQVVEHLSHRGLFWIDQDGQHRELAPGSIYESDDVSVNEPFRFLTERDWTLGRQTLVTIDVFCDLPLGANTLGRAKDAYRVEDIADHCSSIVTTHGLPLVWRYERGSWQSQWLKGIEYAPDKFFGSLGELFKITHTWKSRGKGTCEKTFDLLQSLMAHKSTSVGRKRGEFELATKLFLRAQAGNENALSAFWTIAEAADGIRQAMTDFSLRPKFRRAFGPQAVVPADLAQGWVKRECPPSEMWRFLPVKKQATVRRGLIETMAPHYPLPFCFEVNGIQEDLYLPNGYRVFVAFHPGKPEQGCHIFNGETGAANREGFSPCEYLFTAPLAKDAPQVSFSREHMELAARTNANATVRREYRGIVAAGQRPVRHSLSQNSFGNREELSMGSQPNGFAPLGQTPKAPRRIEPTEADEEAELLRIQERERRALASGEILVTG